jgi:hypothetical protein
LRSTQPDEAGAPLEDQIQDRLADFLSRNIPSEISMVKAKSLAQHFISLFNKKFGK